MLLLYNRRIISSKWILIEHNPRKRDWKSIICGNFWKLIVILHCTFESTWRKPLERFISMHADFLKENGKKYKKSLLALTSRGYTSKKWISFVCPSIVRYGEGKTVGCVHLPIERICFDCPSIIWSWIIIKHFYEQKIMDCWTFGFSFFSFFLSLLRNKELTLTRAHSNSFPRNNSESQFVCHYIMDWCSIPKNYFSLTSLSLMIHCNPENEERHII